MAVQYKSVNGTATVTEASTEVNTEFVLLLANDSLTQDLHVSFESLMSVDTGYIVLKPSEQLKNLDVSCAFLRVKSNASTAPYRFIGLNK